LNNIFRAQIHGESLGANSLASSLEFGAKVQQRAYGLEGIFARGPMKVMGEYSGGQYEASQTVSQMNFDTKTGYVEIGYFLTGEKYADSYKNGVFGGFKPKNNFDLDKGGLGAIELAFRAEGYRVDDTSYTGSASSRFQGTLSGPTGSGVTSKATTYTAGIRWLLNPNAVVKVNYAYTKLGNNYAPIDLEQSGGTVNSADVGAESLFMTRLQYMF
jgi:phosphate-selective porin OprO/OprP